MLNPEVNRFGEGLLKMSDHEVKTMSRLAQWKIESFGQDSNYRSNVFKIGVWNWHLCVKSSSNPPQSDTCWDIFLSLDECLGSEEQLPDATFAFRVCNFGPRTPSQASEVYERVFKKEEPFTWTAKDLKEKVIINVEFLDLKISMNKGEEGCSKLYGPELRKRCVSPVLHENIATDIIINVLDGTLHAHKAILVSSSSVFESMFRHDLIEKESSTVNLRDMCLESGRAFLNYLYGTIKEEDLWKHQDELLLMADMYDIQDLKEDIEESLLHNLTTANVLVYFCDSCHYKLNNLKEGCLSYLFDFTMIYEIANMRSFVRQADRHLVADIFEELLRRTEELIKGRVSKDAEED